MGRPLLLHFESMLSLVTIFIWGLLDLIWYPFMFLQAFYPHETTTDNFIVPTGNVNDSSWASIFELNFSIGPLVMLWQRTDHSFTFICGAPFHKTELFGGPIVLMYISLPLSKNGHPQLAPKPALCPVYQPPLARTDVMQLNSLGSFRKAANTLQRTVV